MRIAHIITAHKNPLQLERLIKAMSHPGFDFYIHVDKKINLKDFEYLREIGGVYFIRNRIVCNWGGFSLFKANFNCLEEVFNSGMQYDFLSLMSGQDYPIKPIEEIYNFFDQRPGTSFISCENFNNSDWGRMAKGRYEKYHFTDVNFKGRYLFQKIVNSITPSRKMPFPLELYGGNKANWWTISSDCAAYLVAKIQQDERIKQFFKFSWGADEFIIPSLIMSSTFKESVVNENYRYVDWSQGKARPKVLRVEDFDKIASSDMLFARKFDIEIDAEILDKVDTLIKR
jgi:hypothetical protein